MTTFTVPNFDGTREYYIPTYLASTAYWSGPGRVRFQVDEEVRVQGKGRGFPDPTSFKLYLCIVGGTPEEIKALAAEADRKAAGSEPTITLHGAWSGREYFVPISIAKTARLDPSGDGTLFDVPKGAVFQSKSGPYTANSTQVKETPREIQRLVSEIESPTAPNLSDSIRLVEAHRNSLTRLAAALAKLHDSQENLNNAVEEFGSTGEALAKLGTP